MPQGPGTYGSKKGRPPKKKTARKEARQWKRAIKKHARKKRK